MCAHICAMSVRAWCRKERFLLRMLFILLQPHLCTNTWALGDGSNLICLFTKHKTAPSECPELSIVHTLRRRFQQCLPFVHRAQQIHTYSTTLTRIGFPQTRFHMAHKWRLFEKHRHNPSYANTLPRRHPLCAASAARRMVFVFLDHNTRKKTRLS